jgi:predicted nuclease of predicted toxin-antitoxin system
MKLLLDQNLPRRLAGELQLVLPGSSHVWFLGLAETTDEEI